MTWEALEAYGGQTEVCGCEGEAWRTVTTFSVGDPPPVSSDF